MNQYSVGHAAVLAATEVVPGDWRDLATVLQNCGGADALLAKGSLGDDRDSELLGFLRENIDATRIEYWRNQLAHLAKKMPDVRIAVIGSKEYPTNLLGAYGRPPFLFINGRVELTDRKSIAIVGSRNATDESLSIATKVAAAVAENGATVVSGLARGVDAAAHRGAIAVGGRTIAVVAVGIDHSLNRESDLALAPMIPKHGAVVSQFRPGSPPVRSAFLLRNGVISGISLVSLLVEASERSGTRSEADFALQQGRRVMLWEPSFEGQSWARLYAQNPRVKMVSTIAEIVAEVEQSSREALDP